MSWHVCVQRSVLLFIWSYLKNTERTNSLAFAVVEKKGVAQIWVLKRYLADVRKKMDRSNCRGFGGSVTSQMLSTNLSVVIFVSFLWNCS